MRHVDEGSRTPRPCAPPRSHAPSLQGPRSAIPKAAPLGMATPRRLIYVCSQARSRGCLRSGMAKLIYVANVSLDGYIEDAHGSFEWTAPTDEVFTFITDLVRPVGTYLYGRRMYETMAVGRPTPSWPPSRSSGPTSRASGKRPTRSPTPRRCTRSRPPKRGSSAASTPTRSAT
jgi:hypothetical protein